MIDDVLYFINKVLLVVYFFSLTLIFLYALTQLDLFFNYLKAKKNNKKELEKCPKFDLTNPKEIPYVTVQLPIFNEKYVVNRLLDNIALLDYPREKLEIQVLDDSTDESLIDTKKKIEDLFKKGLNILHITRMDRKGFKAGALKEGLSIAKGEFIAIFDSDFLPEKDFLYKTIPYFKNEKIGMVQTKWTHINRNFSILTKIQALALDAHFTMEQFGRNSKGYFINFNGTAGIWRKECIYDTGNWQDDTLTEDLNLSYRAQIKGWKFKYLIDVETPAELPILISATKSQQFRWNKGGAENFQVMFKKVILSKLPIKTKFHCIMHLLNSTMFLNILLVAILSVPLLYTKNYFENFKDYFIAMSFFSVSSMIFFACYWQIYKNLPKKNNIRGLLEYCKIFFTFFSIMMGMSLNNSRAVLQGHKRKKSDFIRTPKFNVRSVEDEWKKNKYLLRNKSKNIIYDGLLSLYFFFGILSAWLVRYVGNNHVTYDKKCMFGMVPCDAWYVPFDSGLLLFHVMLFVGFSYVFYQSICLRL